MNSSARSCAIEHNGPPGAHWLKGAVDGHIHACPHINDRCLDVFQAVRDAADAGMQAIGLMDNFANSSGLAALANRELSHLGVHVFGGLIMEPPAGGVDADSVRTALKYGYGLDDGARFISFPTHHTQHTARLEGRSADYVAGCFFVPADGPLPDNVLEILDIVADAGVVLNIGHLSAQEATRLVGVARERGFNRILVPANHFDIDTIQSLCALEAYVEFSFFFVSHATDAGLTHVDAERHTVPRVSPVDIAHLIGTVPEQQVILSSDCGVFLLPPPREGLREFLLLLNSCGLSPLSLQRMVRENPRKLYGITDVSQDGVVKNASQDLTTD
ncbi:MAG: DUF6282 family protein [Granulosicoccus sp.]